VIVTLTVVKTGKVLDRVTVDGGQVVYETQKARELVESKARSMDMVPAAAVGQLPGWTNGYLVFAKEAKPVSRLAYGRTAVLAASIVDELVGCRYTPQQRRAGQVWLARASEHWQHQPRVPGGHGGGQWLGGPGDVLSGATAWASLRDRQGRVMASAGSPVVESQRKGGFMGGTAREVHADGTTTVHKQPEDDRDSSSLTGVRQADAEELGSLVANAFGLHAPAVHRAGPTDLHMELMDGRHIEHSSISPWKTPPAELAESDQGVLLGLLDIVISNPDRHAGNYLVGDDEAIFPFDHSLSFGQHGSAGLSSGFSGPFMNEAMNDWPDKIDVSPDDMAVIRKRLDGLRGDFERLDRIDWFDQMIENLNVIASRANGARRRVA
jgi:hypothetical protein